jgi:hypothetical protein
VSGSNFYDKQIIPALGSFDSNVIDCEHLTKGSFQVVWVDLDQMDGSFSVMLSNDGTSWADETTFNVATDCGNIVYRMNDITTRYCRIAVDNGTNAVGAYKILFFGRIR